MSVPRPGVIGFTSSGFFLAAMMPLSAGSRGVLSPLSQVSTAGSGQVRDLDPAFDFPLCFDRLAADQLSCATAVMQGRSSSSAVMTPT